ncbi:AsmA family protein [Cystobacter fuscus]|uniref:translocation/assembly module TamB domain-containing protein n=1 Tax=Cystobacter fuscus TaxID=43 RepID=UPI002B2AD4EE|nr:AsmA family protein [Cystobacter fuscus]
MSTPHPTRARRWGRRLLWGLVGLIGLVLVLVAGALVYLMTPPGEARLRDFALTQANEQLSGRLELAGLDLGPRSLVLSGVKLYDPDQELVAELSRLEVRVALLPLLRKHVVVKLVGLDEPHLFLRQDARGLNLSRAIALRNPSEPKPEDPNAPRGTLRFTLEELRLKGGAVAFVSESPQGNQEVRLDGLEAGGSASWAAATEALAAKLDATARLASPQQGPVRLALQAGGEEGQLNAQVDFTAPGLELQGSGALEGEETLRAEVKKLRLEPALARAVLPSYPVAAPVTLAGTVAKTGDVVRVDLNAQAADGTATAQGDVNLETFITQGFTVRVRDLDLSKLLGGGPHSTLAAELLVRGGGKSLDTLEGTLDFTMPASPIEGQTLGPVDIHANAKDGRFTLTQLQARAPGLSLYASGAGTQEKLKVEGRLVAADLGAFAHTVGRLGPGGAPMPLSGRGSLDFAASGPVRAPAVSVVGGFDTLAWADTSLQGLTVDVRLPDATQPLTTNARLQVNQLTAGGRAYKNLRALVGTKGRQLEVSVHSEGDAPLELALWGTLDKDNEGLALEDVTLKYPEAAWTLQHPTHLTWGGGRVEVEPALSLTSGEQGLSLALKMQGESIRARTELRALDLSRLPKAYLPASFDVAGLISGEVSVDGRMSRPDARAQLKLSGGRYQQYSDLSFDLDGRYARDRATGTLTASAPALRVSSHFDVPVQGLMKHRREPVDLELTLDHLDIGPALRMAGKPETATGRLSGKVTLKGMANDPRLDLALQGADLRYWGAVSATNPEQAPPVLLAPGALPPGLAGELLGFELTARSDEQDGALRATLDLRGLAQKATVTLETPFTLGGLIARPPTAQQAMETPMRALRAEVVDMPLALLSQYGLATDAGGKLSMTAHLTGPMLAPEGELKVQARRATVNGVVPLDGELAVLTGPSSVKLQLEARREGTLLAQMEAQVRASLVALQDQDVVGHVPFTLTARAGPLSQRELQGLASISPRVALNARCRGGEPRPQEQQNNASEPQNVVALSLSARGTLNDPKVDLTAGVQNIGVRELGLGQARLHYTYADARSAFDALLTSPKGGTLTVRGHATQDLSLPALRQGMDTRRIPVVVELDSHQFDLSFLSGAQLPMVRAIGGELVMNKVRVDGTLGAPKLQGQLELKQGRLSLDGMGDYRDVHVALAVDDQRISLSDFSAQSGQGRLKLKAEGTRTASGSFDLTGEGNLDDFPLVLDDQLFAIIQLRTEFEGDISKTAQFINLRNLSIPEAHIKLPEEKRKDLQVLDRPEGIVLTCQGQPMNPTRTEDTGAATDTATGGAGPAQSEPQRQYRININAPRNLWVQGADVNVEVGLSENFRVEYADTASIYGEVHVHRGEVEVLGRRFNIQNSSQVRFTGPAAAPYINATAEYKNESAGVTVYVAVRGQGKDFTIKPTSDPPLPETDIYTLLATGRRTLKAGSGASSMNQGQVASVLGSLLASQAKKALAAKLPLDVLTIESGDEGLAGARLEVGKYLTDKLYLGYSGRLGSPQNQSTTRRENANSVRLEYQFGPRWGVEAEYGDAQVGGADFIWSKEY